VGSSINIPKLGWTMEEGTVTEWLVSDGATVTEGDPLYILESDKVENEVAAPATGVLRQLAAAGRFKQRLETRKLWCLPHRPDHHRLLRSAIVLRRANPTQSIVDPPGQMLLSYQ